MGYREVLELKDDFVFSEETDKFFLNLGFYYDTMHPRFMDAPYYDQLTHDKQVLRKDANAPNGGTIRVFINREDFYTETQTSYRSLGWSNYLKPQESIGSIESVEILLDLLLSGN